MPYLEFKPVQGKTKQDISVELAGQNVHGNWSTETCSLINDIMGDVFLCLLKNNRIEQKNLKYIQWGIDNQYNAFIRLNEDDRQRIEIDELNIQTTDGGEVLLANAIKRVHELAISSEIFNNGSTSHASSSSTPPSRQPTPQPLSPVPNHSQQDIFDDDLVDEPSTDPLSTSINQNSGAPQPSYLESSDDNPSISTAQDDPLTSAASTIVASRPGTSATLASETVSEKITFYEEPGLDLVVPHGDYEYGSNSNSPQASDVLPRNERKQEQSDRDLLFSVFDENPKTYPVIRGLKMGWSSVDDPQPVILPLTPSISPANEFEMQLFSLPSRSSTPVSIVDESDENTASSSEPSLPLEIPLGGAIVTRDSTAAPDKNQDDFVEEQIREWKRNNGFAAIPLESGLNKTSFDKTTWKVKRAIRNAFKTSALISFLRSDDTVRKYKNAHKIDLYENCDNPMNAYRNDLTVSFIIPLLTNIGLSRNDKIQLLEKAEQDQTL